MPEVIFNGSAGRIQGHYKKGNPKAPIALFLHPHPKVGGSMDNVIIYKLYHMFRKFGFSTLRFNFRGVGRSLGEHDFGEGELLDAADALNWAQYETRDYKNCWIVGYSFGAWIGLQLLMRRPEIKNFIAISPPTALHPFDFVTACPACGLIVCGDKDKLVKRSKLDDIKKALKKQHDDIDVIISNIADADHFYNSKIDELLNLCESYVKLKLEKDNLTSDSANFLLDNQKS